MNLGELYEGLSYGELNGLSIGLSGSGGIALKDKPRIISYANRALTRLYGRFAHKRGYVKITLDENINRYVLDPAYAVSDTDVGNTNPRYITDTVADPFTGGVLKVLSVRDETEEYEGDRYVSINDMSDDKSVQMLDYRTLYIKEPVTDAVLTVEYTEKHPAIATDAPDTTEIYLHPFLEEALIFHVAARVIASIGGEENMVQSQRLFSEYERVCMLAESEDYTQESQQDSHDLLYQRGWK